MIFLRGTDTTKGDNVFAIVVHLQPSKIDGLQTTLDMTLYDLQHSSITIAFGLTLNILVNMTLKQVSNAICSWFDPLSELQIRYHNGIPLLMAFGATNAYNDRLHCFVLNVVVLFCDNHSHISNIQLHPTSISNILAGDPHSLGNYGWT